MRYRELIYKINIINICWYTMKLILYIYNKIYTSLSFFIKQFYDTFHIVPYIRNTIVVKNSEIIHECNYNDIIYLYELDYDYALYKHQDTGSDCKLIKLVNHLDYIVHIRNQDSETLASNVAFIHINIQTLDNDSNILETYDITTFIKNDCESYYVRDAELFTPSFMNWLFISCIKKEQTKYRIIILDNNIKEITLSEDSHIKLSKTSYEIISNTNSDTNYDIREKDN